MDMMVTGIEEENGKILVFNFGSRDYVIDPENDFSITLQKEHGFDTLYVSSIKFFPDGTVMYGDCRKGLCIIKKDTMIRFPRIGQVFGIAKDDDGNLWVGSWNDGLSPPGGLYKYDGKKMLPMNEAFGIFSIKGWTIFYDKDTHLLWYGTLDKGLYLIPPLYFSSMLPDEFGMRTLSANDLLVDKKDRLWIACDSGVIVKTKNRFRYFGLESFIREKMNYERAHFRDNFSRLNDPDKYREMKNLIFSRGYNNFLRSRFVNFKSVEQNSKGEIFVSSLIGLYRFDEKQNKFVIAMRDGFRDFIFNNGDTLVKCGSWSISTIVFPVLKESKAIEYSVEKDNANRFVTKLSKIGNGVWLMSKTDGLALYENGAFTAFNKIYPQLDKTMTDACGIGKNRVAAGGANGVIYIFSKENGKYILTDEISEKQGLTGNSIKWLFGGDRYLLIGTNKGLNVLDFESYLKSGKLSFRFYDQNDGYYSNSSGHPAADNTGKLYLTGDNRLLVIDLNNLFKSRKYHFPVRITGIDLFNRTVNWDSITAKGTENWIPVPVPPLKLKHKLNYLGFHFNALDYYPGDKVHLSYKMEGLDAEWIKAPDNRLAVYASLNPGHYTFKVKARNLISGKELKPVGYTFTIATPWWRQWWFYLLIVVFILWAGWSVILYRTRIIKVEEARKTKIQKQLAEVEITALQSQMNPHFVFNSINSIQDYIMNDDTDATLNYLSDFSYVLRQALENASEKLVPLADEISYLKRYLNLELMRFEGKFEYNLEVAPAIDPEETGFPPMIVQPFVENAIRHGILNKNKKGYLLIKFFTENDLIKCIIEDDGIGREKAKDLNTWRKKEHHSRGIAITQKRLELLSQYFKDNRFKLEIIDLYDDGKPVGTRVIITVPEVE